MSKHLNYTAAVENLAGQRFLLALQISGRDPQGAFDWCCGHRGLRRVSDLEQVQENATMNTSNPSCSLTYKWFGRLCKRLRK